MITEPFNPRMAVTERRRAVTLDRRVDWTAVTRRATPWIAGLATFAGMAVLVVWAAEHGAANVTGTIGWMAGIVFLGLAVDASGRRALLQCLTGVALMVLGWLSLRVAGEFGLLSALLVVGWSMWAIRRWVV